jgi:hypothetical protein
MKSSRKWHGRCTESQGALWPFLTLTDLHPHAPTLWQLTQPVPIEGRDMNKDVLATTILLYETKPFLDVEPFDRTKTFLGRSCTSLPVTHGLTKFVWSLMGQDAGQPLDAGSEGRAKAPPKLAPVSSLRFFADDDLI